MTLTRRPFIAACAALGAVLVLAACGGSDNASTQGSASTAAPSTTTATSTSTSTPTTTQATTTTTSTTQASAEGEKVFAANCASCHTLKAADAGGQVGPNLDDLQPSEATVKRQVENGGGAMPAFKGQLSDAQIAAVSAFVASSAGKD